MTKVTRKLLLSVLSVVLTVVALGATTFAWFTITNVASVQAFDADFKANQGIEIAIGDMSTGGYNDLNWVTNITAQMVYDYINATHLGTGQTEFEFDHVTTEDGITFKKINSTYNFDTLPNRIGAGYLEIPLHFRSESAEAIELSLLSFMSSLQSWRVDVPFIVGLDSFGDPINLDPSSDPINVYGHDAIRVGFTAEEFVDNAGVREAQPLRTTVFEKDASSTNYVLGGGTLDLSGGLDYNGAPGAVNYFYAKNSTLPQGAAAVTLPNTEVAINASNSTVLNLFRYYDVDGEQLYAEHDPGATFYGKLTLRIWVEGWDANAYNAVLGSTLTVELSFTGKLPE